MPLTFLLLQAKTFLFLPLPLCRFLFFGSAVGVRELVMRFLEARLEKPEARRERYIMISFENVDGIDYTGAGIFFEIAKTCQADGVQARGS